MARFFDVEREVSQMDTGMRNDLERPVGQVVQWYEFDNAVVDTLYDEGVRNFRTPKPVPTMGIERVEGQERPTPEGQWTEDTIHFNCRAGALVDAGIDDVFNAQAHINDRVAWDEFFWDVRGYQLAGRVMTNETVIGVDAVRIHPDDLANDPLFNGETTVGTYTGRTIRQVAGG